MECALARSGRCPACMSGDRPCISTGDVAGVPWLGVQAQVATSIRGAPGDQGASAALHGGRATASHVALVGTRCGRSREESDGRRCRQPHALGPEHCAVCARPSALGMVEAQVVPSAPRAPGEARCSERKSMGTIAGAPVYSGSHGRERRSACLLGVRMSFAMIAAGGVSGRSWWCVSVGARAVPFNTGCGQACGHACWAACCLPEMSTRDGWHSCRATACASQ